MINPDAIIRLFNILAATLILVAIVFAVKMGHSHDWYDIDCCGGRDCRPVACDQLIEESDGSVLYLPSRTWFWRDQVHPSRDQRCHICTALPPDSAPGRAICAYVQQGS